MSLVCYLDDSGNEDDPIVTLAGYIAPAGDWLNFEVHARELFDAHKLPYLHAMDLHQRKREFKGWTRKLELTRFRGRLWIWASGG